MRMTPIMQAHSREYHGPINTEQVMLIRCAVGHIPSIRKMGEITTPIATIIARNTMRNVFILCFFHSSFLLFFRIPAAKTSKGISRKKRQLSLFRSKFHYFLSLRNTDSHRFFCMPGLRRSPSDPPASSLSVHSLCYLNICRKMPASTVSYFLKAGKTDDNWISCK